MRQGISARVRSERTPILGPPRSQRYAPPRGQNSTPKSGHQFFDSALSPRMLDALNFDPQNAPQPNICLPAGSNPARLCAPETPCRLAYFGTHLRSTRVRAGGAERAEARAVRQRDRGPNLMRIRYPASVRISGAGVRDILPRHESEPEVGAGESRLHWMKVQP